MITLYEGEKFARIYKTLCDLGNDEMAWLFAYPKNWEKGPIVGGLLRIFVQDLRRANIIAWNCRNKDDAKPIDLADLSDGKPYPSMIELFKSLEGLQYSLGEVNLCDCQGR